MQVFFCPYGWPGKVNTGEGLHCLAVNIPRPQAGILEAGSGLVLKSVTGADSPKFLFNNSRGGVYFAV